MTALEQRKKKLATGIFSLLFAWIIAVVCFDGILFLGLFISKKWLPFFVLAIMIAVMCIVRSVKTKGMPWCYRIPAVTVSTLLISAFIMFLINIFGINWEPKWVKPQPFNELIPYVCALIIYPVACFVSLWFRVVGNRSRTCVNCTIRNGNYTERGLLAKLFQQESDLQLKFLCIMSGIVAVIDWSYYYLYYINVNYNSPDLFFFIGIPTAFTILSVIFFFTRYNSMWRHYCHNPAMEAIHGTSTAMRYIVIVGDHILLDLYNGITVDTPVKCFIPFTTEISHSKAEETFRELTGVKAPRLNLAYESEETTTLANSFHYLCFFNNISEISGCRVQGQLYSLTRVLQMAKTSILAPEFKAELERIYTVAMAWKTYTPEGKRIYPVKNYRPSFRIRDIKDYKVDFNDKRWLTITVNNEDKYFFKLRTFWNRIVNGL